MAAKRSTSSKKASSQAPASAAGNFDMQRVRYRDMDWIAFADLLRSRMPTAINDPVTISRQLGWPSRLLSLALRGQPLRDVRVDQVIAHLGLRESDLPRHSGAPTRHPGNRIFVSYSHNDQDYLDRLMVHLRPLQKKGIIDPWVDTRLKIGDRWRKEIETALKQASVGILLISADFLASDFIVDDELPPLLRAAEAKGTLILPVILKPCRFARENSLNEFQAANSPDEPLSVLDDSEREFVYDSIAQRIEDALPKKSG